MGPTFADHLHHVAIEAAAFDRAVAAADPGRPVVSCPGWTSVELRTHMAEVLVFWHAQLAPDVDASAPTMIDATIATGQSVSEAAARIVDRLEASGPTQRTWNWCGHSQDSGWVARRMAQELSIHRVDAELTAHGSADTIEPTMAADGIDELLDVFVTAPSHEPLDDAIPVMFEATDLDIGWSTLLGEAGARRSDAACVTTLRGTASDVLRALWERQSEAVWGGDVRGLAAWERLVDFE